MLEFLRRLFGFQRMPKADVHPALAIMLGLEAPVESFQAASKLLASASPEDRRRGAHALGTFGDRTASPLLLDAIGDVDEEVRVYAIQSLRHLKEDAAILPLCDLLVQSDVPKLVLTNAIAALAELRDSRAIGVLAKMLKSSNSFVRYDAVNALREIGHSDAIPFLEAILSDETIPELEDEETLWSVGETARRAIQEIRARM